MTRTQWTAQRRRVRDSYPSRADRGLTPHPDGSGLCLCPICKGNGVVDIPNFDPQRETSFRCGSCDGDGYVIDGHRDPLLRLAYHRQPHVRRRNEMGYRYLRQVCATPVWQLRVMEAKCVRHVELMRSAA